MWEIITGLWESITLFVWRCTIGLALFSILLLCGIASVPLGGRRFLNGCKIMALHAGRYGRHGKHFNHIGAGCDFGLYQIRMSGVSEEPEKTNPLSALLWKVLFGIWLQILFLILAVVCHFFLPEGYDLVMLNLAHGVRNPAYVIAYVTGD